MKSESRTTFVPNERESNYFKHDFPEVGIHLEVSSVASLCMLYRAWQLTIMAQLQKKHPGTWKNRRNHPVPTSFNTL